MICTKEVYVESELTALASAAGVTLVTTLTTDMWRRATVLLGGLWQRVSPGHAALIQEELICARSELIAAREANDEDTEQALIIEWQHRLRRLLAADPEAAVLLRELLKQELSGQSQSTPRIDEARREATLQAFDQSRLYLAARDQYIYNA